MTSGALEIEATDGCVPNLMKFNQEWKDFGTVTKESDTTILIKWPGVKDEFLMFDLPAFRYDMESCYYNLKQGWIRVYKPALHTCESQVQITSSRTLSRELPSIQYHSQTPNLCVYSTTYPRELFYSLRPGNHRIQKDRMMRAILRIKTREKCLPRLLKYEENRWQEFGTIQSRTTSEQDTMFLIDWRVYENTDVLLQLPLQVNENKCMFQLETVYSAISKDSQGCNPVFTF